MIRAIFTDLGGVLLTNGWDHEARQRSIEHFSLDRPEFMQRHEMVFGAYEEGHMSLSDYLEFTVFYCPREFSKAEFTNFIFAQSQPLEGMLELLRETREHCRLPIFAISNEGREIAEYRIARFELSDLIDAFVVSSFVGARKPAVDIYRLTTDMAQVKPEEALYLEDRQALVEAGQRMGLVTLWHRERETTRIELTRHGLLGEGSA